MMLHH